MIPMLWDVAVAATVALAIVTVLMYYRQRDVRRASRSAFGVLTGAATIAIVWIFEGVRAIGGVAGTGLSEAMETLGAVGNASPELLISGVSALIGGLGYLSLSGVLELAPKVFALFAVFLIVAAIMISES